MQNVVKRPTQIDAEGEDRQIAKDHPYRLLVSWDVLPPHFKIFHLVVILFRRLSGFHAASASRPTFQSAEASASS
jgi:hypothetical protein